MINICGGGETMLPSNIVDYVRELLEEGHYVMVVSNCTIDERCKAFSALPPHLTSHLFIKVSYHYMELKKRGLLERFFANIKLMHKSGISFTLEATPSDELIPYIEEMKQVALENLGAINHMTVGRDETKTGNLPILTQMSDADYFKTWNVFDSELFRIKFSIFNVKRKEFCYAGKWNFILNLETGEMQPCYNSPIRRNILDEPDKPINFIAVGNNCPQYHCWNGHAFLGFGAIPSLNTPTFADQRNRVCTDGSEWLYPEMKAFMSSRLNESNREYNALERLIANLRWKHRMASINKRRKK